jgi:L-tartrate/succinate antiporter
MARSRGTIFPVIRNLPALVDSKPNDPLARRTGSCLMWFALATACATSPMCLTGLAPDLLALELVAKAAKGSIDWGQWFMAFVPVMLGVGASIPGIDMRE